MAAAVNKQRRASGSAGHGHAAGGAGKPSQRRSSSKGRFDPSFMMSSNIVPPTEAGHQTGRSVSASGLPPTSGMGSRRKSEEDARLYERAYREQQPGAALTRNHRSSDRLHRLGSGNSSANLAHKRSKSQTQLASNYEEPGAGRKGKGNGKKRASGQDDSEDGWTSASANNTPSDSAETSPAGSPADEGLVMGTRKGRVKPPQRPTSAAGQIEGGAPPTPRPLGPSGSGAQQHAIEPDHLELGLALATRAAQSHDHGPPPALKRSDTQVTLRGFEQRRQTNDTPEPAADGEIRQDNSNATESDVKVGGEPEEAPDAMTASTHSRADSDETLAQDPAPATPLEHPAASTDDTSAAQVEEEASHPPARPISPKTLSLQTPPSKPIGHGRGESSTSTRTLKSAAITSSPVSMRSLTSSMRNGRSSLFPRESQLAAPPKLDTHNALAGALGALHEDRGEFMSGSDSDMLRRDKHRHASEPGHGPDEWQEGEGMLPSGGDPARRKASVSSLRSNITLPTPSPSIGNVSHAFAEPFASGGETGESGPSRSKGMSLPPQTPGEGPVGGEWTERRRQDSTQSLTAADAAKLAARLRRARDNVDEYSGPSGLSRGSSAVGLSNIANASKLGYGQPERYSKPIVSTFAKSPDGENSTKWVSVALSSVYAQGFTRALGDGDAQRGPKDRKVRYMLGYGLGGPPIEKNQLNDALLAPSFGEDEFESSWAPALANAAGLGSRSLRSSGVTAGGTPASVAADGIPIADPLDLNAGMVNGPNATPLHFIHALTTTSPDPFPLDPSEMPVPDQSPSRNNGRTQPTQQPKIQYLDPATVRAIALTSQALSVQRSHTVTRRFADPMRESLERVARASGQWVLPARPATPGTGGQGADRVTRWGGRRSMPSSPGGDESPRRPGFVRSSTGAPGSSAGAGAGGHGHGYGHGHGGSSSALSSLADAAEHHLNPVRSLKRVWSGGLARGGLAALTRTEEEPAGTSGAK